MNRQTKTAASANPLLPQLGNISAQYFLDNYWQKKPLLIRGAFPKKFAPLTKAEILRLAGYDEAESRLVSFEDDQWRLEYGPFARSTFTTLARNAQSKWTVLIQDTQHFSHEAHRLLAKFNFLPQTRIDDLMVSYAVKGGGVGAHFDSYDVFLLQGAGKRRWQISARRDLALKPGMPLKILQRFRPDQEWVLEEGDMLYLPPSFAHNGVAESDDCVTWSIGFRSPSKQELLDAWLDDLRDRLKIDGRYADKNRTATAQHSHAAIDPSLQAAVSATITAALMPAIKLNQLIAFAGRFLSQPKSHVTFNPPPAVKSVTTFKRKAESRGIDLDLRTRMLYDRRNFYINGETLPVSKTDRAAFLTLANTRHLAPMLLASASPGALDMIYQQWQRGHFQICGV